MNHPSQIGHNNPPTEAEILKQRLNAYEEEADRFKNLQAYEVPSDIEDDKEAGRVTDYIKSCRDLKTAIDKIHKAEKEPFLLAGREADQWKRAYQEQIEQLVNNASKPVLAWNKKKEEAERKRQFEIAERARIEAEKLQEEALQHEQAGIADTASELMDMAVQEQTKSDMISANAATNITGRSRGTFSASSNRKPWTGSLESRAALDLEALRNYFSDAELERTIKAAVRDGARSIRGATIFQEEKLSVR